jgi:hypothetical protein
MTRHSFRPQRSSQFNSVSTRGQMPSAFAKGDDIAVGVFPIGSDRPNELVCAEACAFDLDLQHCPNCGGELMIIAAILEPPVIEKILTHLGLQARAPPRAPARGQALQGA